MAGCGDYERFDWVRRSRGPIRIKNSMRVEKAAAHASIGSCAYQQNSEAIRRETFYRQICRQNFPLSGDSSANDEKLEFSTLMRSPMV
jgi:hypothetical protein